MQLGLGSVLSVLSQEADADKKMRSNPIVPVAMWLGDACSKSIFDAGSDPTDPKWDQWDQIKREPKESDALL